MELESWRCCLLLAITLCSRISETIANLNENMAERSQQKVSSLSHHNPVCLHRLLAGFLSNIVLCSVRNLDPGLDILPGEPVELFRPQFSRGSCELPSNVTPAAQTLGDGPGVSREPAAAHYQKMTGVIREHLYSVLGLPTSRRFLALYRVSVSWTWPPGLTKAP